MRGHPRLLISRSHVRHTVSSGSTSNSRTRARGGDNWRRSARGRQDPYLFRLRDGVRLHRARTGLLRREGVLGAPSLPLVPREPQGRAPGQRQRWLWRRLVLERRLRLRVRTAAAAIQPAVTAAAVAAATAAAAAAPARCSPRPARPAARRPRSPSAPPTASPSTARTASAPSAAADSSATRERRAAVYAARFSFWAGRGRRVRCRIAPDARPPNAARGTGRRVRP